LRVVNIANSRTMNLRINEPDTSVIAIDGQPVKPYKLMSGEFSIAAGQRYDLMIDMSSAANQLSSIDLLVNGETIPISGFRYGSGIKRNRLLNTPISLPDNPINLTEVGNIDNYVSLHIEGGAMGGVKSAIYQGEKMTIRELIQKRQIWSVNGYAGLPKEPLFKVKRGQSVALNIFNDNGWPHAIHIHGHHFKSSKSPAIWRDTELVQRREKRILKFIADNPGKWLIHCHMIEHQAGGMVSWFEVT